MPQAAPHITLRSKRELEQVHICIGVPALPLTDRRRFAVSLLNNVLGGGMSSRLFQNIRERQGLAYAIFSDMNSYRDAGVLSVYAGTSLETAEQADPLASSTNSAASRTSRSAPKSCAAPKII